MTYKQRGHRMLEEQTPRNCSLPRVRVPETKESTKTWLRCWTSQLPFGTGATVETYKHGLLLHAKQPGVLHKCRKYMIFKIQNITQTLHMHLFNVPKAEHVIFQSQDKRVCYQVCWLTLFCCSKVVDEWLSETWVVYNITLFKGFHRAAVGHYRWKTPSEAAEEKKDNFKELSVPAFYFFLQNIPQFTAHF